MRSLLAKNDVIYKLQKEVIDLQGGTLTGKDVERRIRCGPIEKAFPQRVFPTGVVHEFISCSEADATVTNGFIAALAGQLQQKEGVCLWVGLQHKIYPPALQQFGIDPGRIIFISPDRAKDVLWVIEEGLKCKALTAVVGALKGLSFTESRRLQLAVEESKVTGFIHRVQATNVNTVACHTRWRITAAASVTMGMPGVGYPRWNIQLEKVRNGIPGKWQAEWVNRSFNFILRAASAREIHQLKAG